MRADNDASELGDSVQSLVDILSPVVDSFRTYNWSGTDKDQSWEWIRRAAVVRQYESLNAILAMAKGGYGHFGVTFLRASFEERIWLEYLVKNEALAAELIMLTAMHEVAGSLDAQNQYLDLQSMHAVGFTQKFVKRYLAHNRESNARLKEIGRELGWREGQSSPTTAFVARNVNREREYNYVYHATSRYVHFSPHNLMRQVWGGEGNVTITSENFTKYWTDFALYWGSRTFLETLVASELDWDERQFHDKADTILEHIKKLRPVEIITAAELQSWSKEP